MIKLDNQFLEDAGLGDLPAEERRDFLQYVYNELEVRVGQDLASTMTLEQLQEFQSISNMESSFIIKWLGQNVPDYRSDAEFIAIRERTGYDTNDIRLLADYASSRWLSMNRPDYQELVRGHVERLQQEILQNRDKLL